MRTAINIVHPTARCLYGLVIGMVLLTTAPSAAAGNAAAACARAKEFAYTVFSSDAFYLYDTDVSLPAGWQDKIVLRAPSLRAGQNNTAIRYDASVWTKTPPIFPDASDTAAYRQNQATGRQRLFLLPTPRGWRGNDYTLLAVDRTLNDHNVFTRFMHHDGGRPDPSWRPLVENSWQIPTIFRHAHKPSLWLIDAGHPADFLADWTVYAEENHGFVRACVVRFRPQTDDATTLLPPTVRALAKRLDETLGRGGRDGTLQQTARLRHQIGQAWANAALRPWALSGAARTPHNTRRRMEKHLSTRARQSSQTRRVVTAIRELYPRAEKALAQDYRQRFGLSAAQAKQWAAYSLDAVYRSHYVSPKKTVPDTANARRPWQGERRAFIQIVHP